MLLAWNFYDYALILLDTCNMQTFNSRQFNEDRMLLNHPNKYFGKIPKVLHRPSVCVTLSYAVGE